MKRRTRLPPVVRYIYVIGPEKGLQKVGMATDPQSRLATLQTASPQDLMIHAAIAVPFGAAPDVESQAHRLLGKMRVRNEWFEVTPAEALFAVYTAALPWMERRTQTTFSESIRGIPEVGRRVLPGSAPMTFAADTDTLPLFR